MNAKALNIFRWTLRIFSGVIILFFLLFFVGESPDSTEQLDAESITQLAIFSIGLAGLLLAWKWELTGGIVALVAYAVMAVINPGVMTFSLLLIYPATAILFIVLWALSRIARSAER